MHYFFSQGIMNIDAYHLPDLPLQPAVIETKPHIDDKSRAKSARQYRLLTSTKNKLTQSFNQQPFLREDQFECSSFFIHSKHSKLIFPF